MTSTSSKLSKPWKLTARLGRALGAAALLGSLAVAPVAARAADTTAAERMPKSYAAMMKMKPMEVMHMIDTANHGYVTRDEFLKFQQQLFERMDKDRDGKVTHAEFTDAG